MQSRKRVRDTDVALILPCWKCGGRLARDNPAPTNPDRDFYYICTGCGRPWLIECGGNVDMIVLRVSIPAYETGRHWKWNQKGEVTDAAWLRYLEDMIRVGSMPADRKDWAAQQ